MMTDTDYLIQYTIQQTAELTSLSVHTLRYYERIGLLIPVGRATNGHRRYTQVDLGRLKIINHLRATGMPISQMQRFGQLLRQGSSSYPERRAMLEAHRQRVLNDIDELYQNLAAIEAKIEYYREREAPLEDANAR